MEAFTAVLAILLGSVVLRALAERIKIPYPTLLAVAGAALAASPVPIELPFALDPSLVLALFVAPVLLDTAYDTSVRDLKENWRPVVGLALVAVGVTTAAVAWVAHRLVPNLPWSAAVALGAIVSPPDASAATAVLRSVGLPHRLLVILEGESLLNDAAALLIYRLAVAAALAGDQFHPGHTLPGALLSVIGGIAAGPIIAWAWSHIVRHVQDAPSSIILQFVGTFGIWLIAEALHLSPILAVVTYAMTTAQGAPARTPARLRVPAYAMWETVVVVLNSLAFVLIGLQLGTVIAHAPPGALREWSGFAAVILATVAIMRLAWVGVANTVLKLTGWPGSAPERPGEIEPGWRGGLVVGWAGMRGIVTVATALALPRTMPEHDRLLFTAFAVALGTLVLGGLTLRPLVRLLDLHDGGPVDREIRVARVALADAALETIRDDGSPEADMLRDEIAQERRAADEAQDGDGRPVLPIKVLHARMLERRRERLLALRHDGTIGDDAFHALEEELDFADLATAQRT